MHKLLNCPILDEIDAKLARLPLSGKAASVRPVSAGSHDFDEESAELPEEALELMQRYIAIVVQLQDACVAPERS